jgi:hypothetical protein
MTLGARIGARIDSGLARVKGYGPYGVSLGSGVVGLSMYRLGDPSTFAGLSLQGLGVLMCLFCVVSIFLWHFLQWPRWFGKAPSQRRR